MIRIQETDWYQSRPKAVREKIDAYPPDRLYHLDPPGQTVSLYAYEEDEDGTCTTCKVCVTQQHNPNAVLNRIVFGVRFEHLTPIEEQSA